MKSPGSILTVLGTAAPQTAILCATAATCCALCRAGLCAAPCVRAQAGNDALHGGAVCAGWIPSATANCTPGSPYYPLPLCSFTTYVMLQALLAKPLSLLRLWGLVVFWLRSWWVAGGWVAGWLDNRVGWAGGWVVGWLDIGWGGRVGGWRAGHRVGWAGGWVGGPAAMAGETRSRQHCLAIPLVLSWPTGWCAGKHMHADVHCPLSALTALADWRPLSVPRHGPGAISLQPTAASSQACR